MFATVFFVSSSVFLLVLSCFIMSCSVLYCPVVFFQCLAVFLWLSCGVQCDQYVTDMYPTTTDITDTEKQKKRIPLLLLLTKLTLSEVKKLGLSNAAVLDARSRSSIAPILCGNMRYCRVQTRCIKPDQFAVGEYCTAHTVAHTTMLCNIIIIIIIRNLYSAIMPLGGYRGAGGTGR